MSKTGAELLFELISQRYERGSTIVIFNLPFDEWATTFGEERLIVALLDQLTDHAHILEMNGRSDRLARSQSRRALIPYQPRKAEDPRISRSLLANSITGWILRPPNGRFFRRH